MNSTGFSWSDFVLFMVHGFIGPCLILERRNAWGITVWEFISKLDQNLSKYKQQTMGTWKFSFICVSYLVSLGNWKFLGFTLHWFSKIRWLCF
ncbi:unnamed protein product [Mucor hiemalis]